MSFKDKEKMIYQNDEDCLPIMRKWGCFWRVGVRIGELISKQNIKSPEDLNFLWNICIKKSIIAVKEIDKDFIPSCPKGITPIIRETIAFFKVVPKRQPIEIGTMRNGSPTYYSPVYPNLNANHYYAQEIKPKGDHYKTHWRLVDFNGNVLFDPHNPPLELLKENFRVIIEA